MKDVSLAKTDAKGEYLYNKVQDIAWDEVFSQYITCNKVCESKIDSKMYIFLCFCNLYH